jgi:hypothetical protein
MMLMNKLLRIAVMAVAFTTVVAGSTRAQSLEEQTRRPRGESSLDDDSERLKGPANQGTNSLDDDSQRLHDRTDAEHDTNSLDNGALDGRLTGSRMMHRDF